MEQRFEHWLFSSCFDSGNLYDVSFERRHMIHDDAGVTISFEFEASIRPDHHAPESRTWFYFVAISSPEWQVWFQEQCLQNDLAAHQFQVELKVTLRNMNQQNRLLRRGLRPVCKDIPRVLCESSSKDSVDWNCVAILLQEEAWKRTTEPATFENFPDDVCKITICHRFSVQAFEDPQIGAFFAFSPPFSYDQLQHQLEQMEASFSQHQEIYFHRELLTESVQGRRIDLLTISSRDSMLEISQDRIGHLFPETRTPR